MMYDTKPFLPIPMMCGDCEFPLQSTRRGEFVACPDHGNFVDQTPHYSRYGGFVVVDRESLWEAWVTTLEQISMMDIPYTPEIYNWIMCTNENLLDEEDEDEDDV